MPPRKKGVRKVNKARRSKEWARAYGSLERCFYVAQLACVVPWCYTRGWMENAHIETGGMGMKADATKVVPACAYHHRTGDLSMHNGIKTFQSDTGVDLEEAARLTEESWLRYGQDTVERAKKDGSYARWLARHEGADE